MGHPPPPPLTPQLLTLPILINQVDSYNNNMGETNMIKEKAMNKPQLFVIFRFAKNAKQNGKYGNVFYLHFLTYRQVMRV